MRPWDDERAQSVQIGAVLLFGIAIIAFSSYQAYVVPQQNEQVEFDHNQRVQQQLQQLRGAILGATDGGGTASTTVPLGTRYPPRAVALNPPPASGTLRTVGTGDPTYNLTIGNATADGEPGALWDGDERTFDTGAVEYAPSYNRYRTAPATVYEHTLLYNDFGARSLILANQSFLDGRTISLIVVNGSLDRGSSEAVTVDVRPVSASTERVQVRSTGPNRPITIGFQSRYSPSRWRTILSDQPRVQSVEASAANGTADRYGIRVRLDPSGSYELRLTKVGLGTRVSKEDPAYLDVADEGASVPSGAERSISFVVRDRFDNPVQGVTVRASAGGSSSGTIVEDAVESGPEGRATFTYRTTGSTSEVTHEINGTLDGSAVLTKRPFDQSVAANATMNVTVGSGSGATGGTGGSGAYSLGWKAPDATSGNGGAALSDCSPTSCTWDVGASDDATLSLDTTTRPPFEGIGVEFAVNDSSVATLSTGSGTTGSDGAVGNELTAQSDGTVDLLASANDDSDVLSIAVANSGGSGETSADQVEIVRGDNGTFWGGEGVTFDVRNTGGEDVTLTAFTVEGTTSGSAVEVSESSTGSYSQGQHEVFVSAATDGVLDVDGRPYYTDPGTAMTFGSREPMTEDAIVGAGGTGTIYLHAFRDDGGNAVGMSGSTVTVTLHFGDGSSATYDVQVP